MLSLNVGAWIAQGMLAAMFGMAGMMKSTRPMDGLAERAEWVKQYKPSTVRLIGLVEVAGALGMVLPMVTGILPWLTPLAAIGFAAIQILALPVHLRLGEMKIIPMNLALLGLSLFVVWGRWGLIF